MIDFWVALVRLIVALPLVLGLIYLFLKFGMGKRNRSASGSLQVVDQILVGAKSRLVVVRAKESFMLLAVSESDIKVLKEFSEYPVVEPVAGQHPAYLDKILNKYRQWQGGDRDES
ncbi:flagellar biosynthetic protein FliO [Metallumcola ferriviriculae]|uniref:Flagellar biosynthetic protein FliO n=1 Tax=Metallumcola ferriviriculae TaxID=3039180 RepID=A0AAU0URJ7_9FIRM|nr:flagellar biosynthetic protein FliO [Desulfitibacteraceae bacterium MK1]